MYLTVCLQQANNVRMSVKLLSPAISFSKRPRGADGLCWGKNVWSVDLDERGSHRLVLFDYIGLKLRRSIAEDGMILMPTAYAPAAC